jgi:anti-sigma-K factor RskA
VSTDAHTLSGAYALNAVTREEADLFEEHLAVCAPCRQEVRELQAASAQMAAAEAVPPPQSLKARVMAGAERTPQEPPLTPSVTRVHKYKKPQWFPRLLAAAASIALIVAAAIGYSSWTESGTPGSTLAAGVARVFEAPDAHQATVRTTNGGTVSVATSPSLNRMAVDTDKLPDLRGGRVYQLWAMGAGTVTSAGVLEEPDRGAAMEMPPEGVQVAITIEPAGGSERPTGAAIMTVTPRDV